MSPATTTTTTAATTTTRPSPPSAVCATRIVSLLPSHTAVLRDLCLHRQVVGWTHECAHACTPSATPLSLTTPKLDTARLSAPEISAGWSVLPLHPHYRTLSSTICSFYTVDVAAVVALRPTIILTHIREDEWGEMECNVRAMLAELLPHVRLISSHPQTLSDIYALYRTLSVALQRPAADIIAASKRKLQALVAIPRVVTTAATVAVVQWPSPLYLAADWVLELLPPTLRPHPLTDAAAVPSVRAHVGVVWQCDVLIFAICAVDLEGCNRFVEGFVEEHRDVVVASGVRIVAADAVTCFSSFALSDVLETASVVREIALGDGPRRRLLWDVYPL